jgi:dienelactone hydrolase
MSTWNLTEVYVSKPGDYPSSPARLLLLLTNGTGVHSRNNQHQADLFAREGYLVVMPDMFDKDPAPNSKPTETDQNPADVSWLDTVKLKAAETAKSFMLDMW